MEILITNDDGYQSKGIAVLLRQMEQLGHVTVVAPDGARSGMSNAITVEQRMTLKLIEHTPAHDIYITNGTPSDCVKLAINIIYRGGKPDLVVSGINHGSNSSVNVIYSGTMGACFVAAEQGIPAIGYSLCDHNPDADFSDFEPHIIPITKDLLRRGFYRRMCYNINAPVGELIGRRFTRQACGHWENEIAEHLDQDGNPYYLLQGDYVNEEPEAIDTDEYALAHHFISICPCTIDMSLKV